MKKSELRDLIAEINPEIILFENPSFDKSIIGLSEDNNHAIYDIQKMITEMAEDDNISEEEAMEFIDYNTIRALPYADNDFAPIVIDTQILEL